uniref:SGNH hydrolase-type esterase domain-containing protein n=1 Tax=Ditylum brightwellii TaxID=49249 RepID=A0A7S1ZTL0_9STRA|mmetsp:Transcript_38641/g.57983  ORF Transcript_38641/g.57983 Transcript_38641/m.57983 type:complete len:390 (+) Transcript_38641:57-1226(+)
MVMTEPLISKECVRVEFNDPNVQYEGRLAKEDSQNGAQYDWPLVAISIRFRSEEAGPVVAVMDGAFNRFSALVTSEDTVGPAFSEKRIFTAEAPGTVRKVVLGQVPGRGVYRVKLAKLTEPCHTGMPMLPRYFGMGWMSGMQGVVSFRAWELPSGSTLLPPPDRPQRRIEVIGGSDTCGCGAESSDTRKRTWWGAFSRNEIHNAELCYSYQLATRLNAEVHVEAWTGKGLVKNAFNLCNIFGKETLPQLLDRTLATSKSPLWDFDWIPHAVLIDCGGNDYNNAKPTSEDDFSDAYTDMLHMLRHNYPEAFLISMCGGSTPSDHRRNKAAGRVSRAVKRFADNKAVFIEVPIGITSDDDPQGHMSHHSEVGHTKISDFLEPQIRELMGWT